MKLVPVVNIKGIEPGQLKLNGVLLADIFMARISRWNDPAIVALNPGLALPDAPIAIVRRADGSGTSFIFTNYLSKASPEWKRRVGEGTAVNWPAGAGAKGNEGVAAFVQRLPNSIGYLEYAYARQNRISFVSLQNRDGQFIVPSDASFKAAAAGADWSRSFYQILTDQPGKEAWPITGATFILMHAVQERPTQASTVLRFFDWSYGNGDAAAVELQYVPMPEPVKAAARKLWASSIKDAAGRPVAWN
jgi:phosphate transport system substrate-binding protein